MEKFNETQLDKVAHTLGINLYNSIHSSRKKDKYLPDEFYRNYYNYGRVEDFEITPEWVSSLGDCIDLWTQSKLCYFCVNEKGIELFRKQFKELVTDKYIPLSKSKQCYQDFIDTYSGWSFAEYLGIILPKIEYSCDIWIRKNNIPYNLVRYTSCKYENLSGDWCKTRKEAKESYKIKLKIHKKYLKDMSFL